MRKEITHKIQTQLNSNILKGVKAVLCTACTHFINEYVVVISNRYHIAFYCIGKQLTDKQISYIEKNRKIIKSIAYTLID